MPSTDPELASLDERLERKNLPSEAVATYLKVSPVMMKLREDNGMDGFSNGV